MESGLERAARRLAELYRREGATESTAKALLDVRDALARASLKASGREGRIVAGTYGPVVLEPDGAAHPFMDFSSFEEYVAAGMPLPEGCRGGRLSVVFLDLEAQVMLHIATLARAVSSGRFAEVAACGLDGGGRFRIMDARDFVLHALEMLKKAGGPAAWLREAALKGPAPAAGARSLFELWREWRRGGLRL